MSQLTISIKNEQLDTKNIEEITLNLINVQGDSIYRQALY